MQRLGGGTHTPQAIVHESGEPSSNGHDARLEASGTGKPTSIAGSNLVAILVLRLLLSHTGKSLRLYIKEVA